MFISKHRQWKAGLAGNGQMIAFEVPQKNVQVFILLPKNGGMSRENQAGSPMVRISMLISARS